MDSVKPVLVTVSTLPSEVQFTVCVPPAEVPMAY